MTTAPRLADWLAGRPGTIRAGGPLALILCENRTAVDDTLRHHARLGFRHILALSPETLPIPDDLAGRATCLIWDARAPGAHAGAVNAVNDAVAPGTWLFYAFNAEFLFYPFCETRSVAEMLAFHAEERRDAMLACTIDLYAPPDAGDLTAAQFDAQGYFSLGRGQDRQIDIFGGLRWRVEEHVPESSRHLNRIALFRAAKGLRLGPDHRFDRAEYNTISCPWHHNLTAAIASFRLARALRANPGTRDAAQDLQGPWSTDFHWQSRQLLDLGLIEPGQWF